MFKINTVVFIPCLMEDIEKVMQKHGVPEEFHAMQLARVLTEMLARRPTSSHSECRPTHVRVPLESFRFTHPKFQNLDTFNNAQLQKIIDILENEIASRVRITVEW